ncbi:MAG: FAD-dependent oxidoreductase [Alphaproteobacteria bacterium]|nr:FAD-dependent oxidoreductase [Alphaproteobacteria bacterium]
MTDEKAEIVICGAGIAGVSAAFHLAVRCGVRGVVLVDERPPLTLTSDKSTECYRNWWPGPGDAMVALTNRSIDLLERLAHETDNAFLMNRRGYLFATAENGDALAAAAAETSSLGAGPLRAYQGGADDPDYIPAPPQGFEDLPEGIDLFQDQSLIQQHFPYLPDHTTTVAHARRCGWLSAQQLGMTMLTQAREAGVTLVRGAVTGVDTSGGRINGVTVETASGTTNISTPKFINAAGPFGPAVAKLCGLELPVTLEGHVKISFNDTRAAMPRNAPLVIWNDSVRLPWRAEEREALAASPDTQHLLEPYAAGVHGRPDGAGDTVLLYWTYEDGSPEPIFPVPYDPNYPEIVLRGMSAVIPRLADYFDQMPKPYVDGGYYAKTVENRPLIGPLPLEGAYICGAFSGFGIMTSMAAGDLLAVHITGAELPDYAPEFLLTRYDAPGYRQRFSEATASGQL